MRFFVILGTLFFVKPAKLFDAKEFVTGCSEDLREDSSNQSSLNNSTCFFKKDLFFICCSSNISEKVFDQIELIDRPFCLFKICESNNLKKIPNYSFTRSLIVNVTVIKNKALKEIDPLAFQGIRRLQFLILKSNALEFRRTSLWKVLASLKTLRLLDLSNNRLTKTSLYSYKERTYQPNESYLTELEELLLNSNPLRNLSGNSLFPLRKSRLQKLSIADCKLEFIDAANFEYLKYLKVLILDENPDLFRLKLQGFLSSSKPLSKLSSLSLRYDGIDFFNRENIISKIFVVFNALEFLDLSGNSLNPIIENLFPFSESLKEIVLSDCKISSIYPNSFSSLPGLVEIDLTKNYLVTIPDALVLSGLHVLKMGFPNLSDQKPESRIVNDFKINPAIASMKQLKILHFKSLHFASLSAENFGKISFSLKELKVEQCEIDMEDQQYIRPIPGTTNLTSLSLKGTKFVSPKTFELYFLHGFDMLEELDISRLQINYESRIIVSFANKLKRLYLRGSIGAKDKLESIGLESFVNLEVLDISDNVINTSPKNQYFITRETNPRLKSLIIKKNLRIFYLNENMTKYFCNLDFLDMTDTIFQCSQSISYFYFITKTCPVKVANFKGGRGYFCKHQDFGILSFIDYLSKSQGEESFTPSYHGITIYTDRNKVFIFIGSMGLVLILMALFGMLLVMKLRSNWSYLKYKMKNKMAKLSYDKSPKGIKALDYDAFVSYDNGEENWITSRLIPRVEEENGFKLCVHSRDFVPGRSIADNIVNSLERSKNFILVLSDSYLKSHWCKFEAQMAQEMIAKDSRKEIILIKRTPNLNKYKIQRTLKVLMLSKTYLELKEEDDECKGSWDKLIRALKNEID